MKQILNIFLKDARRLWPEILVSLSVTALFVWLEPEQWPQSRMFQASLIYSAAFTKVTAMGTVLAVLIPVSWWILVSRAIHSERLVGDTQFWLTRPYEWKKLLAAKLAFVVAFVGLPYFVAQLLLLAEAGFSPIAYLPGLLSSLLVAVAVFLLPALALSAVTSNFARLTLTLLGIFLGVACIEYLLALSRIHQASSAANTLDERFTIALLAIGCVVAVVLQYALRRVWLGRAALIAIPLLMAAFGWGSEWMARETGRMNRIYPRLAAQAAASVQLAYRPFSPGGQEVETYLDTGEILVHIPLHSTGVAAETAAIPDAIKVAIEAPDGAHWNSDWQDTSLPKFLPGDEEGDAVVAMPRAAYEELKGKPLTLHLAVALTQAKVDGITNLSLPESEFHVPDFGACAPLARWGNPAGEFSGVACISPLHPPQLTYMQVVWLNVPCTEPRPKPDPGILGAAWVGTLDRDAAEIGISPVKSLNFTLSNNFGTERGHEARFLCPGSPVTFARYSIVRREQAEIDIQDFRLPEVTFVGGEVHAVESR
jgi:hypothetical protein